MEFLRRLQCKCRNVKPNGSYNVDDSLKYWTEYENFTYSSKISSKWPVKKDKSLDDL